MEIGERIKKYRKEKKLTQKQLGELIGVSATNITKYEKGDLKISADMISRIANALEVTSSDIIDIDNKNDITLKENRELKEKIEKLEQEINVLIGILRRKNEF